MQHYQDWDSGYSKQQSTRPQTLGYALVDSPLGQAAWIIEKFWAWTDCDGQPGKCADPRRDARQHHALLADRQRRFLRPPLLGELSLHGPGRGRHSDGLQHLSQGDLHLLKALGRNRYRNIIYWNELDKGGHFAAFEQPEIFVDEVRNCFRLVS